MSSINCRHLQRPTSNDPVWHSIVKILLVLVRFCLWVRFLVLLDEQLLIVFKGLSVLLQQESGEGVVKGYMDTLLHWKAILFLEGKPFLSGILQSLVSSTWKGCPSGRSTGQSLSKLWQMSWRCVISMTPKYHVFTNFTKNYCLRIYHISNGQFY